MRKLPLISLLALAPFVAHAQTPSSFKDLTASIVEFVNTAVMPLLYTLAFLFFLIGMVRFFFLGGEEGREKGKAFMLWGIIGLVVMFSVWGVVNLLLTLIPGASV